MSVASYGNYPNVTITYNLDSINYVIVSYYGNTVATSTIRTSTQQNTGTYFSGDLSFNIQYTFNVTPYNSKGIPGVPKIISVDTTPKITGAYSASNTASNVQLQWNGTYSYVKIYRKALNSPYVDVSAGTKITSMPYYDLDLCGNTTYVYYIQPYDANGNAYNPSTPILVNTNIQAAKDLSYTNLDYTSIGIAFTYPKNSYANSVYYTLRAINATTGTYKDVSGTGSPLLVNDLSNGQQYNCYIITTLDNNSALTSISPVLSVTTKTNFVAGLYFVMKSGYFNDNLSFFITASNWGGTAIPYGFATNLTNINTGTNGKVNVNGADNYSVWWRGYFKSSIAGTYTFYTNSDDSSILWLGANAISGYTISNALVNNSGLHGMRTISGNITLEANKYYNILIMFGENGGGDDCQTWFRLPGGSTDIKDGTGYYFADPSYPY